MAGECPYLSGVTHVSKSGEHLFCAWCPCSPPCPTEREWDCDGNQRRLPCPHLLYCACQVKAKRDEANWDDAHDEWLRQKRLQDKHMAHYAKLAVRQLARIPLNPERVSYDKMRHRSQGRRCRACGVLIVNENISGYCQKCIGRKRAAEMHGMGGGT